MNKSIARKLTLRREHIRLLANRDLVEVVAGLKITDASNASMCLGHCPIATNNAQCNEPTFGSC